MARRSTFDPQLLREGLGDYSRSSQFDWDVVRDPVFGVASDVLTTATLGPQVIDDTNTAYANVAGVGDNSSAGTVAIGQAYISNGGKVVLCGFILYRGGACTGYAYAKIYTAVFDGVGGGYIPSTLLATSDPYPVTNVVASGDNHYFTFSGANQIELTAGTRYVATMEYNNAGQGGDQLLYFYTSAGGYPGNMAEFPVGYGAWIARGYDAYFAVYVRRLQGDTASASLSPGRVVADAVSTSESLIRIIPFGRASTEAISASESANLALPLTRTGSEAVSAALSAARILAALRTVTDNPVLSESLVRLLLLSRTSTDNPTAAMAISRLITLIRTAVDNPVVAESLVRTIAFLKTSLDNPVITEAILRSLNLLRTSTDHPFTSESSSALKIKLGAASDSLVISEIGSRVLAALRAGADNPTASMLISSSFTRLRTTVDALVSSEIVSRQIVKLALTRDTIDALTLSELAKRILNASRNGSDALAISESGQKIGIYGRTFTDALSISVIGNRILESHRSSIDHLILLDAASLGALFVNRSGVDVLSVLDELRTPLQIRLAFEFLTAADVATWRKAAFILKIMVAMEAMEELKIVNIPDEPIGIRITV